MHTATLTAEPIRGFSGPYSFLSNFAPCVILPRPGSDLPPAPTVEHAYQASKTLDADQQLAILTAATPGKAKRLGAKATLRPDWLDIRVELMERLLAQKFQMPGTLASQLIDTYPAALVEDNSWGDTFWGVCNNKGQNRLGELLMARRAELISELPAARQAAFREAARPVGLS